MTVNRKVFFVVFLLAGLILPFFVNAESNFLDTLRGTNQEGISQQEEKPVENPPVVQEPPAPEPQTVSQPPEEETPEVQKPSGPAKISYQIDPKILSIIQQILSRLGLLPPGTRIVIVLPPGGRTPPTQPPSNPPTQPPSQPPNSNGPIPITAETKNEMLSKYKINPIDGNSRWSDGQGKAVNEVMAALPEGFRSSTTEIKREKTFVDPYSGRTAAGVLGYVRSDIPQRVHMMDMACKDRNQFKGTLVHEMTHCFQNTHPNIARAWQSKFRPPSVSSYGNTQPMEDMAESVRAYFQNGPRVKQYFPDRYDFIKKYIMSGKEF